MTDYEFDPVHDTDTLDHIAITAMCAAETGDKRLIDRAITRDAHGIVTIDMAALVAAIRKEA